MKGHLPFYIQNFLNQRSIKVKVGNTFSEKLFLDLGVPQGSSISVTLFLIAINTILDFLPRELQTSLFVDDCRFSIKVKTLERHTIKNLQDILDNLQKWASRTGFKFAEGKSEVLICTRKYGSPDPPNINLTLDNKKLKVVKEKKFLGVWFDWRMNWKTQVQYVKDTCTRTLNLLKTLAFSKTKTDTKMLLRIYKTMILPKLEYGCLAYGTACKSTLNQLDPIHHHGLRLALGAFHTTPVESLYVESNIHSLSYRRKILGLKYYARTLTIDKNNTICNLYDTRRDLLFRDSKRFETPGMKIRLDMRELGIIRFPPVFEQKTSVIPPWIMPEIKVCFEMENFPKKSTSNQEIISEFLKHKHNSHIDIYTDGSKTDTGVGAGIAICKTANSVFRSIHKAQSSKATILTAELKAISMALHELEKQTNKSCVIYSDSKGALQSIQQYDPVNPITLNIQCKMNRHKYRLGNTILFCWVPAHCNIPGNEHADKAAKQGSKVAASSNLSVTAKDLYAHIQDKGRKWLQNWWDGVDKGRKLYNVDPKVGEKLYPSFNLRLEEIKYNRIRLGHTRFTHKHLPAGEDPPECLICLRPVTVKHIFIECPRYTQARTQFFGKDKNNFSKIMNRKSSKQCLKVINFLKNIQIYCEI